MRSTNFSQVSKVGHLSGSAKRASRSAGGHEKLSDFIVPDLKITPRTGGYARGQDGFEQILRSSLALLVNHGASALTLRRIAAESGMNVGSLNYYFKSKEDLIRELLNAVISSYEESFDEIMHEPGASAEARLENLVSLILEDITTKKTTRFFPELWAMANHDSFVYDRMNELYQRARVSLNELIAEINPRLSADQREILALFISASMEGMTVFAGYQKPWVDRMPVLKLLARKSFVQLVTSLGPSDFDGL
ncbi:MAG: TetR/AcrR family transcriptional regulator [Sphingopyxis sp.]|uniref:TetR/AcrR family transcriptional regulator n=1 Tax=Sphingopyxis sp. TaxID=1908224 RepID=UPI001A21C868|nr:TetR/AcrR family transcriptional regulator [Sphingopyxis sp.]MBJ7499588.1 TetR/AcrR family transcriptional regulator [Sphingopyxis sp.]